MGSKIPAYLFVFNHNGRDNGFSLVCSSREAGCDRHGVTALRDMHSTAEQGRRCMTCCRTSTALQDKHSTAGQAQHCRTSTALQDKHGTAGQARDCMMCCRIAAGQARHMMCCRTSTGLHDVLQDKHGSSLISIKYLHWKLNSIFHVIIAKKSSIVSLLALEHNAR